MLFTAIVNFQYGYGSSIDSVDQLIDCSNTGNSTKTDVLGDESSCTLCPFIQIDSILTAMVQLSI